MGACDDAFVVALDEAANLQHRITDAMMPARLLPLGRFPFAMLLGLVTGMLFEITAGTPGHNGFEAWRTVVLEMEPVAAGQQLSVLESLLDPDLGGEEDFHRRWLAWERKVQDTAY